MNLYLTQDRIGTPTGGGAVTYHEYKALESLGGELHPMDSTRVPADASPFTWDDKFASVLSSMPLKVSLAHIYAGCFSATVRALKERGTKVSYTAAAHDINESRKAFEDLGLQFNLPHLTEKPLWDRYVAGYLEADLVICPSTLSKACMESYGAKKVVVIPHGCELPAKVAPPPKRFTVGYLGQAGPDKGLRYLFEAWRKLDLRDATLLIAGKNIDSALPLWRRYGGGNVRFMGFVESVSTFYDNVSLYVQPSVTEGFGIEVLEAMAHGRPVICSEGAGAKDMVNAGENGHLVPSRDASAIANLIMVHHNDRDLAPKMGPAARRTAEAHTWEIIRGRYLAAWKGLSS